jgi:hypothetical protein
MHPDNRVAKVRTQETAWRLIPRLKKACPFNEFVLVVREPGGSCEVHPVGAFHPQDRAAAMIAVKLFAKEAVSPESSECAPSAP